MEIIYIAAGVGLLPAALACFLKNKAAKAALSLVSLLGLFVFSAMLAGFVLPSFIGAHGFWLPFAVCGGVFAAFMLFAWKPFNPKARRKAACALIIAPVLLSAVLAGPALYRQSMPQAPGEEINLWQYTPFGDAKHESYYNYTLVENLNEEPSLQLQNDLPRLDGATALYPLYSAFVRAVYPARDYSPYEDLRDDGLALEPIAVCSRTGRAFENLLDGYADVIFLMGVSDEQRAMAEGRGIVLELTAIGREAFVFFVNKRNSITDLSIKDIKAIYSGEAANWQDVGGNNAEIKAYQRPDESGSQTMLKQIMWDTAIAPAPKEDVYDLMMGMYQRVAGYRNYKNSLGYSFLYYIRDMINEDKVKYLSIEGIFPARENIASGAYPFANDFYAITASRDGEYLNEGRRGNIKKLLEWIKSPQGQYLVEATGYVPAGRERNET